MDGRLAETDGREGLGAMHLMPRDEVFAKRFELRRHGSHLLERKTLPGERLDAAEGLRGCGHFARNIAFRDPALVDRDPKNVLLARGPR
ncbi:MAG: hypothetical protein EBR51_10235, partial [Gammaproteobacteria bacterium]|nr:hypothetical protein [Gammaproteobacteria bacterium]